MLFKSYQWRCSRKSTRLITIFIQFFIPFYEFCISFAFFTLWNVYFSILKYADFYQKSLLASFQNHCDNIYRKFGCAESGRYFIAVNNEVKCRLQYYSRSISEIYLNLFVFSESNRLRIRSIDLQAFFLFDHVALKFIGVNEFFIVSCQ